MFNMRPNSLIYGARYDNVMEAFGGKGFFVEDPKDIRGALDEAMNHRGPALVNIVLSQGSARKPQHSAGTADEPTPHANRAASRGAALFTFKSTNRYALRSLAAVLAYVGRSIAMNLANLLSFDPTDRVHNKTFTKAECKCYNK